MPDTPSLLMSCARCLRLHAPLDPERSNPVCPSCAAGGELRALRAGPRGSLPGSDPVD